MTGTVINIYVSSQKGKPMHTIRKRAQVTITGIRGDRYQKRAGAWSKSTDTHRDVTFFSLEDLENGNQNRQKDNKPLFCPEHTRRNIFTQGIDLNLLKGKRFQVGTAIFEWTQICDPCTRPSALSGNPDFKDYFEGGIRARVIKPGYIKPHDTIVILE
jgi:MOSC domain-containing protein YiiM